MTEPIIRFDDGAAYERMMGAWSRLVGEQFLAWLEVPKGARWIDVGCGNGAFTELIAQRTAPASIEGIDPSEGQIAFARGREATRPARFRQGNAMALPFGDGEADVAAMALVLFFVPEPEKGVAEMVRVTRPGGTVAAYVWDMDGGGFPLFPVQNEMSAMGVPTATTPRPEVASPPALQRLWTDAGLQDVETCTITVHRGFESFDDYWQACLAGHLGIAARGMPEADVAELRRRVAARFPDDGPGPITRDALAYAVKGRKGP
ncbi:class I SAM-dependent methyltransferase [Alsobacter sp. R-9]